MVDGQQIEAAPAHPKFRFALLVSLTERHLVGEEGYEVHRCNTTQTLQQLVESVRRLNHIIDDSLETGEREVARQAGSVAGGQAHLLAGRDRIARSWYW